MFFDMDHNFIDCSFLVVFMSIFELLCFLIWVINLSIVEFFVFGRICVIFHLYRFWRFLCRFLCRMIYDINLFDPFWPIFEWFLDLYLFLILSGFCVFIDFIDFMFLSIFEFCVVF